VVIWPGLRFVSPSTTPVSGYSPLYKCNLYINPPSAGTFSLALQAAGKPNGGADGSLLTDPNEVLRSENNGLQGIVAALKDLPAQVGQTPGDVLQVRIDMSCQIKHPQTLIFPFLSSILVGRDSRCRKSASHHFALRGFDSHAVFVP
jgi:hypothetical protein